MTPRIPFSIRLLGFLNYFIFQWFFFRVYVEETRVGDADPEAGPRELTPLVLSPLRDFRACRAAHGLGPSFGTQLHPGEAVHVGVTP